MLPALNTIDAAGRTLAWREAGDGAPVVLLHGISSGSASWQDQLAGLSETYRVMAWDAPGYGGSDPLGGEAPAVADYAQAVTDLLDALDLVRVHLLGHSMGALIAAAFAARRADRLVSLTLASPTAGYGNAEEASRRDGLAARIGAIDELGPAGMAEARAHTLLSPAGSPAAVERIRRVMAGLRPDGFKQAARMMYATDIHADARAVSVPALVMCGGADTVTPEAIAQAIAAEIPGARYETLPGLGHASYIENPAMFNERLAAFLESVS